MNKSRECMYPKIFLCGLLILIALACSKQPTDHLQYEQKVLYEVAPKIIDSIFPETSRGYMLQEYAKDSSYIWEKEDSVNVVIGVLDSVQGLSESYYGPDQSYTKKLAGHFSGNNLVFDSITIKNGYRFNILKLKPKMNHDFRYFSEIKDHTTNEWTKTKDFYLEGLISFSRIKFDKGKRFGLLQCAVSCGQQCGMTSLIYIKREKEKWVIDDIETIMWE
nr:hypothetical protein [Allomuricauda sp.]